MYYEYKFCSQYPSGVGNYTISGLSLYIMKSIYLSEGRYLREFSDVCANNNFNRNHCCTALSSINKLTIPLQNFGLPSLLVQLELNGFCSVLPVTLT